MGATENSEVTDSLHIKYLLNDIRIEKRTENMNRFQLQPMFLIRTVFAVLSVILFL
jgi:hypothetical protein